MLEFISASKRWHGLLELWVKRCDIEIFIDTMVVAQLFFL